MKAMKSMKEKSYHLAIVDPPYGIGLDMINGSGAAGKNFPQANGKKYPSIHKNKDWNDSIPKENYFKSLHLVTENQIIWGCNYYASYITSKGRIFHDKETDF